MNLPLPSTTNDRQSCYTLSEAAGELRVSTKTLSTKLKELRATLAQDPLHARVGRKIIISRDDLNRLYEAFKECPSNSFDALVPITSISAAPSESKKIFSKLRALTTVESPKKSE